LLLSLLLVLPLLAAYLSRKSRAKGGMAVHGRSPFHMSPRKSFAVCAFFLGILITEFLWFSYLPLHPFVGHAPASSHYVITYQNASQWIMSSINPLGQLTSFLVFDDWGNIYTLFISIFMVLVLLLFAYRDDPWLISAGLFVGTNLAGLPSPTAIYLSPPSNLGGWGVYSATFTSLGFAFVGGLWTLHSFASLLKPKPQPVVALLVALLTVFVIGSLILMTSVSGPNVTDSAFHVHLVSLSIGGIMAAVVYGELRARAKVSGRLAFRSLEDGFQRRAGHG
jgi:hypothetical protein